MTRRVMMLIAAAATVVTFAVVQDRVTAAGARRYVALQREAVVRDVPLVSIDEVVGPAVRRSVVQGMLWSGGVLVAGLVAAGVAGRRGNRA